MKKMIVLAGLLSSIVTMNAHAVAITAGFYTIGSSGATTMYKWIDNRDCKAQAEQILVDTQAYQASGNVSVFLDKKIKDAQAALPDLSEEEVLEVLVANSNEVLK